MAHAGHELAFRAAGAFGCFARMLELDGARCELPGLCVGEVFRSLKIRKHRLLLCLEASQPLAHIVDALGELAHVIPERTLDPVRKVSFPELLSRAQDRRQMPFEEPAQEDADDEPGEGGHHRRRGQPSRARGRRLDDSVIRVLDDFRRAIAVIDGAIDGVVEEHDDVRGGLGRGFLRRIFHAGLHEDIERGPEPLLFETEPGHPFVLRSAQRHGLKLGEDVANRVQVLQECGELFT